MSADDRRHGRSVFGFVLELVLISAGVFLGLLANNWHEDREHHAKTQEAIRNFLSEMQTNLQAMESKRQYHETLAKELDQFLSSGEAPTEDRLFKEVHYAGAQPILFEHTAWDLALATQSLSYLPSDLAFEVSKVYTKQAAFETLENSFLAAGFMPGTFSAENLKGFAGSLRFYLRDVNSQEPPMIDLYRKVIPELRKALDPGAGR